MAAEGAAAVDRACTGAAVSDGLPVRAAPRLQDRTRHAGREERVLHRRHLRSAGAAGGVAEQLRRRQLAARAARREQGRHLRGGEDRRRDAEYVSRPVLRQPDDALRRLSRRSAGRSAAARRGAVRTRPAGSRRSSGTGRTRRTRRTRRTSRTRRGATGRRRRPWTESAPAAWRPRLLQAGGHQRRRRDGSDRADQRLRSGGHGRSRSARDSARPRRLDHVPGRQQHLRRLAHAGWPGQRCGGRYRGVAQLGQRRGAAVPAAVQRSALRQQHPHRRPRHGVAAAAEQQVQPVLQRDAQSLRLRLQSTRRGVHLRQRHGVGRQRAVVSRGADGPHDPGRRRRLSQRHGQVPGRVLRHHPGTAPPAPRLAGRRRVLSELRLSGEVLRQPVRGRLVAGTVALYRAHRERRRPTRAARISRSSSTASRCRSPISRLAPTATST